MQHSVRRRFLSYIVNSRFRVLPSCAFSGILRGAGAAMFGIVELTSPSISEEPDSPEKRYWLLLADTALRLDEPSYVQQRNRTRWKQLCNEFSRTGLDFLRAEVTLGITFARAALCAGMGSEKRLRNTLQARRAYDTVMRLGPKKLLGAQEADQFNNDLGRLKDALVNLGERF